MAESYFGFWGGGYEAQFRKLPVFFYVGARLFICREAREQCHTQGMADGVPTNRLKRGRRKEM